MGTPFPTRESENEGPLSPPPPPRTRKRRLVAAPAPPPPPRLAGVKQCFRVRRAAREPPAEPVAGPSHRPDPKRHSCDRCGKKFNSPGKLNQHSLSHTGELPFGCRDCDKKFNSKFKLVRHGLIHSETRPFRCHHCDKTFHRKDHLANHERVHDPAKSVYVCEREACNKRYTSLLSFRKHAALHAAEEGDLQCKICSEVFDTRADIVYHLKVHAGSRTVKNETDKKFDCDYCHRKFFTAKDVRRHTVVHTGRRDFHCQFCLQKFGRKDHLVRHVKKAHPGERATPAPAPPAPEPKRERLDFPQTVAREVEIAEFLEGEPSTSTSTEPIKLEDEDAPPTLEVLSSMPSTSSFMDYFLYANPMISSQPEMLLDENVGFPTASTSDEGYGAVEPAAIELNPSSVDIIERGGMDVLQMLETSTTTLPAFNQAFQNAAQSPKPPQQHPPE